MKNTIFEYKHYRDYLKVKLATTGANRGLRTKLAEKTRTHPAFISKVLSGANDLSPEHIPPTSELLGHTPEESHFFALLVLHARAGTSELKKYYQTQIQEILRKREEFLERVKIEDKLPASDHTLYYSKWYFIAIHILVSISKYQTRETIAERLKLSLNTVSKATEALTKMGLIEAKNAKFIIGKKRIHLEKDSPWIMQMHTNARAHALQKIADGVENDLHFSGGFTMSKKLFEEYRSRLLDVVTEFEKKFDDDEPEDFFCLNIDLFRG